MTIPSVRVNKRGRPKRALRPPSITPGNDLCGSAGAQRVRSRLEAFWINRGFEPPQVTPVPAGFDPQMRETRVDIRSDMLNGQPRRKAQDGNPPPSDAGKST